MTGGRDAGRLHLRRESIIHRMYGGGWWREPEIRALGCGREGDGLLEEQGGLGLGGSHRLSGAEKGSRFPWRAMITRKARVAITHTRRRQWVVSRRGAEEIGV